MNEEQAREWIAATFGHTAVTRIERFLAMVEAENQRQNLVAPSTLPVMWQRHAADSAQLVPLAKAGARWLDVGTGGGFPGIIVAMLHEGPVAMAEPRKLRAAFLRHAIDELQLDRASVFAERVEHMAWTADVISARAVATIGKIVGSTKRCASPTTIWLLPRGRADASIALPGMMFHVEQSLTDPDARIVVASMRR